MDADSYLCPGCHREVPIGPRGCPRCRRPEAARRAKKPAKRERKSWEQDSIYDALDLPDEDFDYEEYVAREHGNVPHRKIGIAWYWWLTALLLVLLIAIRWGTL